MSEDMGNITPSLLHLHLKTNGNSNTTTTTDASNARILSNPTKIHRRNRSDAKTSSPSPNKMASTAARPAVALFPTKGPVLLNLSAGDIAGIVLRHPLPCMFALCMLFFMGVEYTIKMIPFNSPPLDIGFTMTRALHAFIAESPTLNSVLAASNTVFVLMQTVYILWTLLVEGRPRPTIAAIFMFTCRGILGSWTQLPLPQDFLGSGMDFPVGNVSFFLFYSGHVAGAVIASLDMRRMRRYGMAWTFDVLNVLQVIRLLATRGHYTIDLAVGIGAGMLFDSLAGGYERSKNNAENSLAGGYERSKNNVENYGRLDQPCCGCSCR